MVLHALPRPAAAVANAPWPWPVHHHRKGPQATPVATAVWLWQGGLRDLVISRVFFPMFGVGKGPDRGRAKGPYLSLSFFLRKRGFLPLWFPTYGG